MNERAGVEAGGRGGRASVCIEARGAAVYLRSSVSESVDRQEEISREAEMLRGYIERRTHRLMEGAEEIIRFRSTREAGAAARYLKVLYPQTRRELCAVFPATVRRYLQYTRGRCHLLALAIHEKRGWPMVGVDVGEASYPTTGLIHVAVEYPSKADCSRADCFEVDGGRPGAPESASRHQTEGRAEAQYLDVRGIYCSSADLLRACGGRGDRTEHSRRVTRRDIEESELAPIIEEAEQEAEEVAGELLSWLDRGVEGSAVDIGSDFGIV